MLQSQRPKLNKVVNHDPHVEESIEAHCNSLGSLLTSIIVSEPSGISNRYLFGATSIMWKPPQSTLPTAALIQGACSTDNTSVHSWTGVLTLVCGTDSDHIVFFFERFRSHC